MRASLIACLLLVALPARAQDLAENRRVQSIEAVERGVHFQLDMGASGVVSDGGQGVGPAFRIVLGNDFLPFLSGGVGAMMSGLNGEGGDLFVAGPIARLQLALLTSERDFLWARVDGGLVIDTAVSEEAGFVGGALAYEHFAKLRHFSLGLSAGVDVYTAGSSPVAITISPLLKYTF